MLYDYFFHYTHKVPYDFALGCEARNRGRKKKNVIGRGKSR